MVSVLFALSVLLLPLSFSVNVVVAPVLSGGLLKSAAPVPALGMVVVKPKFWALPRGSACLMIVTVPQFEIVVFWIEMSSGFEVTLCDERDSQTVCANVSQGVVESPRASLR